jgi:uncharacterized phage protein (TIGR01671 family)
MERQIKFRAFDKERKVYIEPKDLMALCGETTKELKESAPYLILEQFTGLLDKNGVEVFEGDILRCKGYVIANKKEVKEYENSFTDFVGSYSDAPFPISEVKYFDNEIQWWSGNNCGYRFKNGSFTCMISQVTIHNMEAEIIGNIHTK